MNIILWLLLAGSGLAAASELFKRRKVQNLPDITDEQFLRMYKDRFRGRNDIIIEERKSIANHIGIPYKKLAPHYRFDKLSKYTGFVGEYEVGMGDLEDKLDELSANASIEKPHPFPATIGEFIYFITKARETGHSERHLRL